MKARPLTLANVARRVSRLEQWKQMIARTLADMDSRLKHLERQR